MFKYNNIASFLWLSHLGFSIGYMVSLPWLSRWECVCSDIWCLLRVFLFALLPSILVLVLASRWFCYYSLGSVVIFIDITRYIPIWFIIYFSLHFLGEIWYMLVVALMFLWHVLAPKFVFPSCPGVFWCQNLYLVTNTDRNLINLYKCSEFTTVLWIGYHWLFYYYFVS